MKKKISAFPTSSVIDNQDRLIVVDNLGTKQSNFSSSILNSSYLGQKTSISIGTVLTSRVNVYQNLVADSANFALLNLNKQNLDLNSITASSITSNSANLGIINPASGTYQRSPHLTMSVSSSTVIQNIYLNTLTSSFLTSSFLTGNFGLFTRIDFGESQQPALNGNFIYQKNDGLKHLYFLSDSGQEYDLTKSSSADSARYDGTAEASNISVWFDSSKLTNGEIDFTSQTLLVPQASISSVSSSILTASNLVSNFITASNFRSNSDAYFANSYISGNLIVSGSVSYLSPYLVITGNLVLNDSYSSYVINLDTTSMTASITVPSNLNSGFYATIIQGNTAQFRIDSDGQSVIIPKFHYSDYDYRRSSGRWSVVGIQKISNNSFIIYGDLTASVT